MASEMYWGQHEALVYHVSTSATQKWKVYVPTRIDLETEYSIGQSTRIRAFGAMAAIDPTQVCCSLKAVVPMCCVRARPSSSQSKTK